MLKITVQLRNYAKHVKSKPRKVQIVPESSTKSIFGLKDDDIQAIVGKSTKPVVVAKKKRFVKQPPKNAIPVITCKRPELNFYKPTIIKNNAPFESIPLASAGWQHHKSKNDFFIIHPMSDNKFHTVDIEADHIVPFDSLDLDPALVENLRNQFEVTKTTYVQQKAIPVIASGVNTLIAAETGCGKTIAFLLPIIMSILERKKLEGDASQNDPNAPRALILTPGRELALQIGEVVKNLTRHLDIDTTVITGGATKRQMMQPTFRQTDILVGSIGATSKLITTKIYRMHNLRHLVLDEADTLFDDSFRGPLAYLMKRLGYTAEIECRNPGIPVQLIMASASLPENTRELLMEFVDPNTITEIVSPNLHKLLPQIQQKFIRMRKAQRPLELLNFVKPEIEKSRPIIVFGNKATTTDYISIFLNDNGVKAVSLNGDMLHKIRVGQFEKFQSGEVNVLATTDVSSRGLDTTRACHVVNFDFPLYFTDYLHRIGRIGRMGSAQRGTVTNYISNLSELELTRKIEHAVRTNGTISNVNNNFTRDLKKEKADEVARLKEEEQLFAGPEDKTF